MDIKVDIININVCINAVFFYVNILLIRYVRDNFLKFTYINIIFFTLYFYMK